MDCGVTMKGDIIDGAHVLSVEACNGSWYEELLCVNSYGPEISNCGSA